MRRTLFPLFVLAACQGPEGGLDNSVIEGTVMIPPGAVTEDETRQDTNDTPDTAFGLGPERAVTLTYRAVALDGDTSSFTPAAPGDEFGDPDWYAFTPIADGPFTVDFSIPGGAGANTDTTEDYLDAIVYTVRVYDLAALDPQDATAGVIAQGSTDGADGLWSATFDVVGGADYAVIVGGAYNDTTTDPVPYHMVVSGSAPAAGAVIVGAYLEGDPAVASNPAGGAEGTLWTWDAESLTWSGFYEMKFIRTVSDPPEGSEDTAQPIMDEGLDSVFLTAGTMKSLNKSPSAGSLYSSVSIEVPVPGTRVMLDEVLVLDAVFPKVIGQTVAEAEPDTTIAQLNADYTLNLDTLVAQDLGMLSGLGYVDIVDGGSDMSSGVGGWADNDADAFAFTVPEPMLVSMVASWADTTADIDFGIWGAYASYGTIDMFSSFSSSYCLTGADPEVCTTIVTLEPDVTYYLLALGYLGNDVEPYHIELEWLSP